MSDTREGFLLSPQQRRLWAVGGREIGSPFVASGMVEVRGPLDVDVLREVLGRLSARHEVLRTSFYVTDEMTTPLQVVTDRPVPVMYAGRVPASPGPASATGEVDQANLDPGPDATPGNITLLAFPPDRHMLTIRLPALCCDRRGLENLVADIARGYAAAKRGLPLADEPLQYVDAATWLNDALESDDAAAGRQFWQQQAAPEGPQRLPFERSTPDAVFLPIAAASWRAPAQDTQSGLPGTSQELVLACWLHLLQRLTDNPGLVVAIEHDGRQYAELEQAVGLYARVLPLGAISTGTLTTAEVMTRLAAATTEAIRWADAFDGRAPTAGQTGPLFPFVFGARTHPAPLEADDVVFTFKSCHAEVDWFTVQLVHTTSADGVGFVLRHDSGAVPSGEVQDLARHLRTLVAHAASAPDVPMGTLPLVGRDEWAAYTRPPCAAEAAPACAHVLFEDWAARTPDALAVTCEDQHLTFAQLNTRANQLAHRLRRLGVGPETTVGLHLHRSVDLIVGLLGILKAGGAYVALDPHLPASRLETMATAAGVTRVVSHRAAGPALRVGETVWLDDDPAMEAAPADNPASAVGAHHLAYVLFTSGSTGQPKGVAVEHAQLSHYIAGVRTRLELPDGASYATVTTLAADLGNTSIFGALTSGGHLHVIAEDRVADAERFADYCGRHRIDVLKIVPSHLRALLSASRPERVLPAQRLVLGGDACPWDLVALVRARAPGCRVFNHYGPTEATVGAAAFEVVAPPGPTDGATVPIGRPLDHAAAYVLDEAGRPVPTWCTGELSIGGYGVARGYVNAPADAAPAFLPDPFHSGPGRRMYRTGDKVRLRPGGVLEFLGRIDDQVKIRGFRIEPGEVEAALRAHPAVDDAAVFVSADAHGESRLMAAVASRDDRLDDRALKAHLASSLPDYMVPATVAVAEALPRTANGKVDRAALATLVSAASARAVSGSSPDTEWERAVADIWQELLGIDEVTLSDNFYDLGGHSLLAIQAVTALEKRRGVRIAARDLVFHTLRQFAALCESKMVTGPVNHG